MRFRKIGQAADGYWENCVRSQGAYFERDRGVILLRTMFLVFLSSSINVFIFHITCWIIYGQAMCVCVCVFICTHTYAISLRLGNDKEKEVYMATHFNRYILDLIDIYWLPSIHSIFFLHQHCNFLFDNIPHFLETAVQELITSSASSNWGKNVSACLD